MNRGMPTIAVWFSCGAASAVAAKMTIDKYGKDCRVFVVNNPIKEEDGDNVRFKKDVGQWIGQPIIEAVNPEFPNASICEVFDRKKYMSGVGGAPCTLMLKKMARYHFERTHEIDYHVLGFTRDEVDRHKRFTKYERSNVIPVLIDAGISKGDCFAILHDAGIKLPRVYSMGYPNANCIGCVKSSSPTYWNLVRQMHPEVFAARAEQSRRLGCRLVKVRGERIFLDELDPRAVGGKLKSYDCGIFCDL